MLDLFEKRLVQVNKARFLLKTIDAINTYNLKYIYLDFCAAENEERRDPESGQTKAEAAADGKQIYLKINCCPFFGNVKKRTLLEKDKNRLRFFFQKLCIYYSSSFLQSARSSRFCLLCRPLLSTKFPSKIKNIFFSKFFKNS